MYDGALAGSVGSDERSNFLGPGFQVNVGEDRFVANGICLSITLIRVRTRMNLKI